MAKKQKITAVAVAKAMDLQDDEKILLAIYNEHSEDPAMVIPINPRISLMERTKMVSDIVDMVFISDENGTRYCPAFQTFAIEYNIVNYFTDVSLPADPNKASKFLEMTNLANRITQLLPDDYVEDITSAIVDAIEYRKQEILKETKLDSLIGNVLNLIQTLNQKVKEADISQIMEFIEKNMPEFKGQVEQLITRYSAETDVDA